MVAYNFQARFADQVATGCKRQTIRLRGKRRHARHGDALQLYMGMRTKACRKLFEAACTHTAEIRIERSEEGHVEIKIDGARLDALECYAIAVQDGFSSLAEMVGWFEDQHGLPFEGVVIQW